MTLWDKVFFLTRVERRLFHRNEGENRILYRSSNKDLPLTNYHRFLLYYIPIMAISGVITGYLAVSLRKQEVKREKRKTGRKKALIWDTRTGPFCISPFPDVATVENLRTCVCVQMQICIAPLFGWQRRAGGWWKRACCDRRHYANAGVTLMARCATPEDRAIGLKARFPRSICLESIHSLYNLIVSLIDFRVLLYSLKWQYELYIL